ncbi:MAG: hypothetical protein L3K15_04980 [Thermoplasmata archaeon]|nr:hypothetical protein [Thermoplasmata archaeon]
MMRIAPAIAAGLFALVALLLFAGIYVALPQTNHFYALTTIGVIALLLAVIGYLTEALAANPGLQRAFAWGFSTMGFAVLFAAYLLPLNPGMTGASAVVPIGLLIVLLIGWMAGIAWRSRTRHATDVRSAQRNAWASKPAVSAFAYGAGGTSGSETPPPPSNTPTPPGGP